MIAVGYTSKRNFFDRPEVMRRVDAATRRTFIRVGGLVRTIARRSMRKRKGASPPGKPPHSHRGLIRDHLFFAYEHRVKTMVAGPELLSGRGMGQATWLNEHGGQVTRRTRQGVKQLLYPPRPYMQPAFKLALERYLPGLLKNSVR